MRSSRASKLCANATPKKSPSPTPAAPSTSATAISARLGSQAFRRNHKVRILNKYGYPPDLQEVAVRTVFAQAEVLYADWAVAG